MSLWKILNIIGDAILIIVSGVLIITDNAGPLDYFVVYGTLILGSFDLVRKITRR